MKKAVFLITTFVLVAITGLLLLSGIMPVNEVAAGTSDNVFGWAWSETIGWVSFNSTTGGGGVDYGVDIADDGLFSGYAWSENIGWLTFNQAELSNCPSLPCWAKLNTVTFKVSGWARALAYGDGWDGWVSLRGTAADASPYGVSVDPVTKEFEGWAWGDDKIGWVSFNCNNPETGNVCGASDYKVKTSFNFPPTATNLSVNQGDYCDHPLHPIFSWTFIDPDLADTQGAYWLQVDNNSNFSSPEVNTGKVVSVSGSYSPPSPLYYNTTYFWRLRVWDNQDDPSLDWIEGPSSFTTHLHAYPDPGFSWLPPSPSQGELVQFCATKQAGVCAEDVSTCYNINNQPISCSGASFLWTFEDAEFATGSSPTSENPQVRFKTTDVQTVSLQLTDDVGMCPVTKSINVTLPLPKWKEISP